MVNIIQQNDTSTPLGTTKTLYQCEECGLRYAEKEIAEQCQAWCREHKSCNLDLIKHAVNPEAKGAKSKR